MPLLPHLIAASPHASQLHIQTAVLMWMDLPFGSYFATVFQCHRCKYYDQGHRLKWQTYQRDAEAPHVCPDVIVRFGGIWRVYSFRLQEREKKRKQQKKRKRKKRTGNTKVSCPESVHCVEWDFCKHSLINTQSLNTFKSCALSYTIVTVTTKPALWFPHLVCSQFVYTWLIKIFYSHQVILHSTVHNKAAITGYQGWILRHPKIKVN